MLQRYAWRLPASFPPACFLGVAHLPGDLCFDREITWNKIKLVGNVGVCFNRSIDRAQSCWKVPHNPLISQVLFLYGYIEKAGTGTTEMIRKCRRAELPEPQFRQVGDQ
jgi:hypothetical protein